MRARYFILDFVNYIFMILLAIFFLYYIILGNRIEAIANIVKALIPLSYFALAFAIKLKFLINKLKKGESEGQKTEYILYLDVLDKIKIELLVFLIPIVVILIAYFFGSVNAADIYQALIIFIIAYIWQSILFNKAR